MEFWRLLKEGLLIFPGQLNINYIFRQTPEGRGHGKHFYSKGGVVTIYEFEAKNHPPPTPP